MTILYRYRYRYQGSVSITKESKGDKITEENCQDGVNFCVVGYVPGTGTVLYNVRVKAWHLIQKILLYHVEKRKKLD
jgi:hypothetical protein